MARVAERVACELCGREVDVHESYVVRIDVFADPSVPQTTGEELAGADFDQQVADLLEQRGQRVHMQDQLADPVDLYAGAVVETGVAQGLHHREVGVGQVDVLADEPDPHGLGGGVDQLDERGPTGQVGRRRVERVQRRRGRRAGSGGCDRA